MGHDLTYYIKDLSKKLNKKNNKDISVSLKNKSVLLEGEVDLFSEYLSAGYLSAKYPFKGVVNRLSVKHLPIPEIRLPTLNDFHLQDKKFDVTIIGGGIIGSAIARQLSKWDLKICLLEKEYDVAVHASSRNDGMVHPGFAASPSTLKSKLNIEGNRLYTDWSKELGFKLIRPGSVILMNEWWYRILFQPTLMRRAKIVGIPGVRWMGKKEVLDRMPALKEDFYGALFFPSTGCISPYKTTIAMIENAIDNGVEVFLNTAVLSIAKEKNTITKIKTNRGEFTTNIVINAAGVWADKIAAMVDDQFFSIHPRKGHILILDKKKGSLINSVIARPVILGRGNGHTKGGGLVPTIEGNILVGPDAVEILNREDFSVSEDGINSVIERHLSVIPSLSRKDIITYFSGIRAASWKEDFIVEPSETVTNLLYAAGIQSPGVASAPAIAKRIEGYLLDYCKGHNLRVVQKKGYTPIREERVELNYISLEERSALIKKNPHYGKIVCRCEDISEGEVLDALNSNLPPTTLNMVKRRTRIGMGRCQGGFCTSRILQIMSNHFKVDLTTIAKKGDKSILFPFETKQQDIDYPSKPYKASILEENKNSAINNGEEAK